MDDYRKVLKIYHAIDSRDKNPSSDLAYCFCGFFIGGGLVWYTQFPAIDKISEWVEIVQSQGHGVSLLIGGLVYTILLSLPFIPGVELGLVLMCLFGKDRELYRHVTML